MCVCVCVCVCVIMVLYHAGCSLYMPGGGAVVSVNGRLCQPCDRLDEMCPLTQSKGGIDSSLRDLLQDQQV